MSEEMSTKEEVEKLELLIAELRLRRDQAHLSYLEQEDPELKDHFRSEFLSEIDLVKETEILKAKKEAEFLSQQ